MFYGWAINVAVKHRGLKNVIHIFSKSKMTSSVSCSVHKSREIQFTVMEEERNQKIFTFNKLESENQSLTQPRFSVTEPDRRRSVLGPIPTQLMWSWSCEFVLPCPVFVTMVTACLFTLMTDVLRSVDIRKKKATDWSNRFNCCNLTEIKVELDKLVSKFRNMNIR